MNINQLIAIIKQKLKDKIDIQNLEVQDKSFLHKKHSGYQEGKFHLKIILKSNELKSISRIDSNKKVYKVLEKELKDSIHSLQILIS